MKRTGTEDPCKNKIPPEEPKGYEYEGIGNCTVGCLLFFY